MIEISNPEPSEGAGFGLSVAVWMDTIVVAAPQALNDGVPTGVIYVFEGVPEPRSSTCHLASVVICLLYLRKKR